jgi:hypothetical protein
MDYDFNKNVLFERDEIADAVSKLFRYNQSELIYTMDLLFRGKSGNAISYDELNGNLLAIHFGDIWLKRQQGRFSQGGA